MQASYLYMLLFKLIYRRRKFFLDLPMIRGTTFQIFDANGRDQGYDGFLVIV